ncbi:hypothetical protein SLA2020_297330 [Shorea laevis]
MKPPSSVHHPPSQTSSIANTNRVAGAGEAIDTLVKSEEMVMTSLRSGFLRTALRGGSRSSAPPKRGFAFSSHHDQRDTAAISLMSHRSSTYHVRKLSNESLHVVAFSGRRAPGLLQQRRLCR